MILNTRAIEKALIARGLLPTGCRLVEVSIEPNAPLVIRYEVFVDADQLNDFADAMKEAAVEAIGERESFAKRKAKPPTEGGSL